jgi:hypothetical protein
MSDLAQVQVTGPVAVIPTPSCVRSRRPATVVSPGQGSESPAPACRATARQLLDRALAGARLGGRDRQFLARLVHWDKRSAASVARLLDAARQAGRAESGQIEGSLSPRQLETVLAALEDATLYRAGGAGATCWDCEIIPGGRCADHARDSERARAYAELSALLSDAAPGLPAPRDLARYRQRAPVAS